MVRAWRHASEVVGTASDLAGCEAPCKLTSAHLQACACGSAARHICQRPAAVAHHSVHELRGCVAPRCKPVLRLESVQVHFSSFPSEALLPYSGPESLAYSFWNALKVWSSVDVV